MKKQPVIIKDIVEDIIKKIEPEKVFKTEVLNSSWAKAIGENNVRHAKPVEVKDKILVVHVDSSSWLHKLTMEKARLLKQLRNDLGEGIIENIKLRIGAL
ncbi:MAG: hypothetical protein AMJ78_05620 [Omnitrophica WOR_2 bacterium SM23_29]|nr:MAG: hypothetical protein AMJ78_05620 [Omnitrophica WOR_2 bacterium SM23_29]